MEEIMEINKMKTAVIGCGMISQVYMEFLSQKNQIIDLVACCDLDENRAKEKAQAFGIKAMTLEEIINDPDIELVVNLTNPNAHYSIAKQVLEHKKHVFSEKMIAVELEEGKELCELAKKNGVRLGVAPDTFLGGSIQTAKYIVDSGLIGEVTSVIACVNRDFNITGDILPHLNKLGGGLPFDVGCYYLTALASILGPVKKVCGFTTINRKERVNNRLGTPAFLKPVTVESDNIMVGALQYENGVLGSIHFSSESIMDERRHLEIHGTKGIVILGDPNTFDGPVYLQKMLSEPVQFPFTHGYTKQSRGIGAVEMAWAIRTNRPHRASMEMAYHVFETLHGIGISSKEEKTYHMNSTFTKPEGLMEGYLDVGAWGPVEERVLFD
jgi:predicted dehydrogenase